MRSNDLITLSGDPNVAIQESKAFVCDVRAGADVEWDAQAGRASRRGDPRRRHRDPTQRSGRRNDDAPRCLRVDPERAISRPEAERMGFFTDTTTCIGCKACEVACKQWNDLPADGSVFRSARPTTTRRS
jgi:NAD-dependent dihydropyrimidine dehydrogenase PreA subunit